MDSNYRYVLNSSDLWDRSTMVAAPAAGASAHRAFVATPRSMAAWEAETGKLSVLSSTDHFLTGLSFSAAMADNATAMKSLMGVCI